MFHATKSWRTWGGLGICCIAQACSSGSADSNNSATAVDSDEASDLDVPVLGPSDDGGDFGPSDPSGSPAVDSPAGEFGDISTGEGTATPEPPGGGNSNIEPGTLTAGAWDDNRNLDRFLEYRADLYGSPMQGLLDFEEADHLEAAAAAEQLSAHVTLDVALVIDSTGSMGDELAYLQSEFDALSLAIETQYPGAEQRWALVVYRDEGDEYESRAFDFEAASSFRGSLGAQSSGGGGDIPEAPDAAFDAMNQLSWRAGAGTARLAFWVADAPHHAERAGRLSSAIRVAAGQGIHLYPVASSGVNELTELSMRSAAQLTLGRYLFLTDDSGVGLDHKEPTIPCYFVTRLDDAILRMVEIEMSGAYREPVASDVIRAGGNPADGACLLESGQTVFAF